MMEKYYSYYASKNVDIIYRVSMNEHFKFDIK